MPAQFRRALFDEWLQLERRRAFSPRAVVVDRDAAGGGAVRAACVEPPTTISRGMLPANGGIARFLSKFQSVQVLFGRGFAWYLYNFASQLSDPGEVPALGRGQDDSCSALRSCSAWRREMDEGRPEKSAWHAGGGESVRGIGRSNRSSNLFVMCRRGTILSPEIRSPLGNWTTLATNKRKSRQRSAWPSMSSTAKASMRT